MNLKYINFVFVAWISKSKWYCLIKIILSYQIRMLFKYEMHLKNVRFFFLLEIPQSSFFHIDKIKTSHWIIPSLDYCTLLNRTVHVNLTTLILIIFTPHIDPFQSIHKKSVSMELITQLYSWGKKSVPIKEDMKIKEFEILKLFKLKCLDFFLLQNIVLWLIYSYLKF